MSSQFSEVTPEPALPMAARSSMIFVCAESTARTSSIVTRCCTRGFQMIAGSRSPPR